jgi:hypothetical protein
MNLLTSDNTIALWEGVVKEAEDACEITLEQQIETYLVSLLNRYIDKPELVKKIFATSLLEALQLNEAGRKEQLKHVGDQCLLYAGLFPHSAARRLVKLSYFVDLGRSSYAGISSATNDLYGSLALQFVMLMDVLQSIRHSDLMPLEAYEQWRMLGSQRALKSLQQYSHAKIEVLPRSHK